jgi:Carboxypeptidase regulatory-like domain/TonB-dependent Receptor Plug Domain
MRTHPIRPIIGVGIFVVVMILSPLSGKARPQNTSYDLRGQVVDENGEPVSRVEVKRRSTDEVSQTLYTDAAGRFELRGMNSPQVYLSFSKPGFFRIDDRQVDLSPGMNEVTVTLNHATELEEKVEVESEPVQIDPDTTSHQESLVQHEILNVPVPSGHDLSQYLATMPQVVADVNGRVHVAGARQAQIEVLLDGFEINDPATGNYTTRVDVDAVRSVTINTGGYGAEYAHASAGILELNTQTGDDKWRLDATNFIPDLSFQEGVHFGNWYPRAAISGPIKSGKAWFSDALSIQHNFVLLKELPRGQNIDTLWSGDNLFRAQVNLTSRNILQGSFLVNRWVDPRQGLGVFSPLSTTNYYTSQRYFVSVKDQIWMGRTLFDVGAAIDTGSDHGTPQGTLPYILTPSGTAGNYFQRFTDHSRRLQFAGNVTSGALDWLGKHTLSAGWNVDAVDFSQQATRGEIDFQRSDTSISDRAIFTNGDGTSGPASLHVANTQLGGYAQDLWRPWKPIVFSVGVRTDWDHLIHENVFQPRIAMNWVPSDDGRMKFTLAWGKHYQPLNLSIFGQAEDQERIDQFYIRSPTPCTPPIPCAAPVPAGPPIVTSFLAPLNELQQPRSYNTTAEWQERFFKSTFFGVSYLLRESRDGFAWETQPAGGTLALHNNREDRYVAGEAWLRHTFGENAQLEVDYTRSRSSSNEVLDPNLGVLILTPQQPGPLPWDTPHRVVSSGWTPIPIWGLLLSGFFEYHTGFPFSVLNEQQQLVGAPNRMRFPNYFSLNLGLEKRFRFQGHEWAVRVSGINVTGHSNPNSVVNNIDAPNYLTYAGGQQRAFTVRLRLVTQH